MKTTIRASHKNGNKIASAQSKNPSIHGQNHATIGHIKSKEKEKVNIALQVGIAVGLSEDEMKALPLLADWQDKPLIEYCREAIRTIMRASFEDAEVQMRCGQTERARFDAANFLGALPENFRRAFDNKKPAVSGTSSIKVSESATDFAAIYGRMSGAECSARQTDALMQLMFLALDNESAAVFRNKNGHLAAGLQSLMWIVRDDLDISLGKLRESIVAANAEHPNP